LSRIANILDEWEEKGEGKKKTAEKLGGRRGRDSLRVLGKRERV